MKVLAIFTGAMCFDGITNSVYNYYAAMDRSGMQIDVVSSRSTDPEMKKRFGTIGCTVYPLECRDINPLIYIFKLANLVRKNKYDVVHAHGNSATLSFEMLAALLGGCKVRIAHSRNSSCERRKADKVLRPLFYATYTDALACGDAAGRWLFGNREYTIMNNGKDISRFLFNPSTRNEFRKKLNADDNIILLGHVGLFHKQKNHEFLIHVFNDICCKSDRYRLVLIGEGEERSRIEQMVQNYGLWDKCIFLGQQTNVEDWLQALDIMIFPSWFEGMPNVVLEWQIAGLYSIISDSITRECKVLDTVEYLSLSEGDQAWAERVLSIKPRERNFEQDKIKEAFIKAGFDINSNAAELKEFYYKCHSRVEKRM